MSWSIYVQGEAQKVCDSLDSFNAYPNNGPESQSQIQNAKKVIRDEIALMVSAEVANAVAAQHPSDKHTPPQKVSPVFVRVEAAGHHDASGHRTFKVDVGRLTMLL